MYQQNYLVLHKQWNAYLTIVSIIHITIRSFERPCRPAVGIVIHNALFDCGCYSNEWILFKESSKTMNDKQQKEQKISLFWYMEWFFIIRAYNIHLIFHFYLSNFVKSCTLTLRIITVNKTSYSTVHIPLYWL